MGSNFCLEFISIPVGQEPNWSLAMEKIENMAKLHLSKWKEAFDKNFDEFFDLYFTMVFDYRDETEPDMNDRMEICEDLIDHLKSIRKAWDEGSRESVRITLRKRKYLFTGGDSYGDPPTDLYEWIRQLLTAGVLQAAGFEPE